VKRGVLICAAVLFVFCCMTGCDLTPQAPAQQEDLGDETDEREMLAAQYIDVFESQSYYIKYRGEYEDEKTEAEIKEEYEVAVREKSLSIRVISGEDVDSTMLIVEGKKHILDHKEKVDQVSEPEEKDRWMFPTQGYVFKETGTAELEGVACEYEEYTTDSGDFRFFFDDAKKLVRIEAFSEDDNKKRHSFRMVILEWSVEIPEGIFEIPDGYKTEKG